MICFIRVLSLLVINIACLNVSCLAESANEQDKWLDAINLGQNRSIYEHQPSLRCIGRGTDGLSLQRISIYKLLAVPNDFAGKKIVFTGHLGRQDLCNGEKLLTVYATDSDLKMRFSSNSVSVFPNSNFEGADKIADRSMVEVVGVFKPIESKPTWLVQSPVPVGKLESASIRLLMDLPDLKR